MNTFLLGYEGVGGNLKCHDYWYQNEKYNTWFKNIFIIINCIKLCLKTRIICIPFIS